MVKLLLAEDGVDPDFKDTCDGWTALQALTVSQIMAEELNHALCEEFFGIDFT
jgi:hypothetical protein